MTIYYPDISSAQAGIDLAGAVAACCKATEGTSYTNPDYLRAKSNAAIHGTFFFAYHFLRAGNAAAQAQHCHGVAGSTPVMLDFEPEPAYSSFPRLADAEEFADEFRRLGGTVHLAYLPRWYWQELGSPPLSGLADRGLRLVSSDYVAYTDSPAGAGWQPYGGMSPFVWQYTNALRFGGHAVDFNAFRGTHPGDQSAGAVADTLREFESIARTGAYPPPPGPYRHEVPPAYTWSLDGIAAERHMTVAAIAALSKQYLTPENLAVLNAYLALDAACAAAGYPHPRLPQGLVYWTANP